jgi:predicted dehydrogenase
MNPLGVGIIGTGWVARQHIEAFQKNPGTRLVGMVGITPEVAEQQRQDWQLADVRVYPDYDAMLRDPLVQIVSIATPNYLHAEQAILAARAGKNILIEKPPAIQLADLLSMQKAVKAAGVKTIVSFVLRWNPLVKTMKKYISSGELGKIFFAQVDYWHTSGRGVAGHWTTQRSTGGSAFLTGGNHAVDAIRWLVGSEITEVTAYGAQINPTYEYQPTMLAIARFENGAVGKISAVLEAKIPYQFNIDLLGERGTFRNERLWLPETIIQQNDWLKLPTITPNSGDVVHHPFVDEVEHFVDCIRNDRETIVNLEDAVKTIQVCMAIDRSAATGQPVKLPLSQEY